MMDEGEEKSESRTPPKRRVEMKDHKASPVLRLKTKNWLNTKKTTEPGPDPAGFQKLID